jgi:hypothetical protein
MNINVENNGRDCLTAGAHEGRRSQVLLAAFVPRRL